MLLQRMVRRLIWGCCVRHLAAKEERALSLLLSSLTCTFCAVARFGLSLFPPSLPFQTSQLHLAPYHPFRHHVKLRLPTLDMSSFISSSQPRFVDEAILTCRTFSCCCIQAKRHRVAIQVCSRSRLLECGSGSDKVGDVVARRAGDADQKRVTKNKFSERRHWRRGGTTTTTTTTIAMT